MVRLKTVPDRPALRRNFPLEIVLCGFVLRMRPQQGHRSPSH
jgi:hypothetical protein